MQIKIEHAAGSYEVTIERGCLGRASELMNLERKCLIVTDEGVPQDYVSLVAAQCKEPLTISIKEGESSKSMANLEMLLSTMLGAGFTRGDAVIAIGGGMAGDLGGFAAATYMRGIDFYNIPTTLLSQADSSIGGKTAVNLGGAKNPVGAFWQPKAVLIDTSVLESLPKDQIAGGMAEIIKSAMIADAELFEYIENNDEWDNEELLTRSLLVKKRVVEADERESGLRKILNYGHTIGHGVEAVTGMLHGHAVALGMLAMCPDDLKVRLESVLIKAGLPTKVDCDKDAVYDAVLKDKKMKDGRISAAMVKEIGSCEIVEMSPEEIRERIERL